MRHRRTRRNPARRGAFAVAGAVAVTAAALTVTWTVAQNALEPQPITLSSDGGATRPSARPSSSPAITGTAVAPTRPAATASATPGSSQSQSLKDKESSSPSEKAEPPERRIETEVVRLTNEERASEGCDPLRHDSRLRRAARKHSTDMAKNGYFDHTSRDGRSPWDRIKAEGYRSPGAENIAKGYRTAAQVVNGWMNSKGHRANILNCRLKDVGIGVSFAGGTALWTQDFGWG